MSIGVSLGGSIEHGDLQILCRELEGLHTLSPNTAVAIDLRGLERLGASALAVLIASLRALRSRQICDPVGRLTPPVSGEMATLLSRPSLEGLLSSGAGRGQLNGGGAPTSRGCEPFSDGEGIDRAVSALRLCLIEQTVWSEARLSSFGALVADIAENVLQHSHAHGGVAAMRVCPETQRVELAIADAGIGIRESLARNPEYEDIGDDLTAIRTAIGPGATGDPGAAGGLGLYLARLVVRENEGSFSIRSGNAGLDEGEEPAELQGLARLYGTLIVVRARTDHDFDYDRIEDWLKEPMGVSTSSS